MSLETVVKVAVTVVATAVCFSVVWWVWTTQIDLRGTASRLAKKPFEKPAWVATRDPKKVYQDGVAVGDITGEVTQDGKKVRFAQLANTSLLKRDKPIEYKRYQLRIVAVEAVSGTKISVSDQGSQVLNAVMEGVTCDIIEP